MLTPKFLIAFLGLTLSAQAVIVMTEDFESADVNGATPNGSLQQYPDSTSTIWVSNQSFNGFRKYIVDENFTFTAGNSTGSFTTPDGEQGYTFGYSSAVGMTSNEGAFGANGTFTAEGSMTLDFLWGRTTDETDPALTYITFFAFNPATTSNADRDTQGGQDPTGTEGVDWIFLGSRTSYSSSSSTLSAYQHSVTLLDPTSGYATDVTGWDLAVRITGDNFQYGVIDDLSLDITQIPEPSVALLSGLGFMLLLRRKKR